MNIGRALLDELDGFLGGFYYHEDWMAGLLDTLWLFCFVFGNTVMIS